MADNKSNLSNNCYDSECSKLLSTITGAGDDYDPAEIADDPVAAESFNIEKRFMNAAHDKDNSPSALNGAVSKGSDDSFDWLEDDKDLYEITKGLYTGPPVALKSKSSLYDNVQPDDPQSIRLEEKNVDYESEELELESHSLLSKKLYYSFMLFGQVILISISALSLFGKYDLGSIAGLPIYYWSLLGSLITFVPFLCSWTLRIFVKVMRHSGTNGELPNFIDCLRMPIVLFVSTVTVFSFWFKYFPRGCPPSDNPVSFCFYDFAYKIFYGLVITSVGFAAEVVVMFFATLKFHERTFKTRIINCRFKIYIVQQLALKALDSNYQRQRLTDGPSCRILSSASQDSLNLRTETEESSYIGELIKLFKSFFSTSTIVSGSQRALGNAANFVQIQVEDNEATVPVTHSSSQSYEKFSQKLRKHMKLYGYSQFAENKTGLKDAEARVLARDLFTFLCPHGKDFLTLEDLSPCFASSQAVNDAMDIFDQDQNRIISKKEFRNTIVAIYADLRDLTQSIKTAGSALDKLDIILKLVFVAVTSIILMTLFEFNVTSLLTLTLSAVIGLNFMIGDLARHFLSSLILLFVNHPFDIGDTIVVGLFEEGCYLKDVLTVKHINLMTTVFNRWNGQETYVPNHMLANAPFMTNLSRTIEQWEMLEFKVPSITPESALTDLRKRIGSFLQMNENYYFKVFDLHAIVAADMAESEKNIDELEFNLRVKCKPTSDAQKRWARHAKLLKFIKVTLEGSIYELVKNNGNIPWEISTRDVVELIEPFLWKGKASQDWVHIPIDRVTGKTLSDLFVEIPTLYEAKLICSNLDKSILKQRALNVSMSDYDELIGVLIKPEETLSKKFISVDEVESLLDICLNYKIHFSRKCAERPFEHILSLFRMIPWHLLKQNTVDLLFELIKNAIESLKYHVSRPSSQIDKNLLSRMISTALHYPAFSVVQKQHFIQEKSHNLEIENSSQNSKKIAIKSAQ